MAEKTIRSYRVRRLLKFGEEIREWGDLAPEAHLFRRVDHLVHSGQLTLEEMDLEEFRAGVEVYCPHLAAQIGVAVGLDLSDLVGPAPEPYAKDEPEPAEEPEPQDVDSPEDDDESDETGQSEVVEDDGPSLVSQAVEETESVLAPAKKTAAKKTAKKQA